MRIAHLDKEIASENINNLIEIDKTILDNKWTVDNFLMDLDHKWGYSLIALEDDLIVGFLICSVKENTVHIHRIAVSPKYQQKKVGSTLMNYLFDKCYKSDITKITLKVQTSNVDAQRFYMKLGFKKEGIERLRYLYKKKIE